MPTCEYINSLSRECGRKATRIVSWEQHNGARVDTKYLRACAFHRDLQVADLLCDPAVTNTYDVEMWTVPAIADNDPFLPELISAMTRPIGVADNVSLVQPIEVGPSYVERLEHDLGIAGHETNCLLCPPKEPTR